MRSASAAVLTSALAAVVPAAVGESILGIVGGSPNHQTLEAAVLASSPEIAAALSDPAASLTLFAPQTANSSPPRRPQTHRRRDDRKLIAGDSLQRNPTGEPLCSCEASARSERSSFSCEPSATSERSKRRLVRRRRRLCPTASERTVAPNCCNRAIEPIANQALVIATVLKQHRIRTTPFCQPQRPGTAR